jgi:hypothetical protein
MAARREYIRPDFDPIVVTLDKGPEVCIQREGNKGVDYEYFVNNNSGIMYLPKAGRDALMQTGAQAGDSVEICKARRGNATLYFVHLVKDTHEPAPPPARQLAAVAVEEAPKATYAPQPQQVKAVNELSAQLAWCMHSAIDAMAAARDYAATRSLTLDTPSWEDIRALAITAYIQRSK